MKKLCYLQQDMQLSDVLSHFMMTSSCPSPSMDQPVSSNNNRITDFSIEKLLSSDDSNSAMKQKSNHNEIRPSLQGHGHGLTGHGIGPCHGSTSTICRQETKQRTFSCALCHYRTDRRNNLERHAKTMHSSLNEPHQCCDQLFSNKAALRQHTKICHKDGYSCARCGKSFPRRALLARHAAIHSGFKRHRCWFCGYATSHKSNFDRHLRVHRSVNQIQGPPSPSTESMGSAMTTEALHPSRSLHNPKQTTPSLGTWLGFRHSQPPSTLPHTKYLLGLPRLQQPFGMDFYSSKQLTSAVNRVTPEPSGIDSEEAIDVMTVDDS